MQHADDGLGWWHGALPAALVSAALWVGIIGIGCALIGGGQ